MEHKLSEKSLKIILTPSAQLNYYMIVLSQVFTFNWIKMLDRFGTVLEIRAMMQYIKIILIQQQGEEHTPKPKKQSPSMYQ